MRGLLSRYWAFLRGTEGSLTRRIGPASRFGAVVNLVILNAVLVVAVSQGVLAGGWFGWVAFVALESGCTAITVAAFIADGVGNRSSRPSGEPRADRGPSVEADSAAICSAAVRMSRAPSRCSARRPHRGRSTGRTSPRPSPSPGEMTRRSVCFRTRSSAAVQTHPSCWGTSTSTSETSPLPSVPTASGSAAETPTRRTTWRRCSPTGRVLGQPAMVARRGEGRRPVGG